MEKESGRLCQGDVRIQGYDLARSVALFFMMIINFKCAFEVYHGDPEWLYHVIEAVEGRAAALFVMLAGIGVSLLTKAGRGNWDLRSKMRYRTILMKRAFFLFFVGWILCLVWAWDILHYYALFFLVASFLFDRSSRFLKGMTALSVLILIFYLHVVPDKAWGYDLLAPVARYSWIYQIGMTLTLFEGNYPFFPWMTFFLIGMWLGREKPGRVNRPWKMVLAGGVLILSAAWLDAVFSPIVDAKGGVIPYPFTSWFSLSPYDETGWGLSFFSGKLTLSWALMELLIEPKWLFLISATGSAFCALGVCLYIGDKIRGEAVWFTTLCRSGRMVLTLYVAHILFGITLGTIIGVDEMGLGVQTGLAVVVYLLSLVLAYFWLGRFSHGPLETVMRHVSSIPWRRPKPVVMT